MAGEACEGRTTAAFALAASTAPLLAASAALLAKAELASAIVKAMVAELATPVCRVSM